MNDGCQLGVDLKMPVGTPLGSACMTEAGEIAHVSDSMKLSPLSHGQLDLKGEEVEGERVSCKK